MRPASAGLFIWSVMSSQCKAICTMIFGPLVLIGLVCLFWTFPFLFKWSLIALLATIVIAMLIEVGHNIYKTLVQHFDEEGKQ